jgi:DNA-3-methyladenine glycosylase II
VPGSEPRLARAVALAYGLPGPATPEQIAAISDKWRPYRTWVTLLLRTLLEDEGTQRVKLGLARGCA